MSKRKGRDWIQKCFVCQRNRGAPTAAPWKAPRRGLLLAGAAVRMIPFATQPLIISFEPLCTSFTQCTPLVSCKGFSGADFLFSTLLMNAKRVYANLCQQDRTGRFYKDTNYLHTQERENLCCAAVSALLSSASRNLFLELKFPYENAPSLPLFRFLCISE